MKRKLHLYIYIYIYIIYVLLNKNILYWKINTLGMNYYYSLASCKHQHRFTSPSPIGSGTHRVCESSQPRSKPWPRAKSWMSLPATGSLAELNVQWPLDTQTQRYLSGPCLPHPRLAQLIAWPKFRAFYFQFHGLTLVHCSSWLILSVTVSTASVRLEQSTNLISRHDPSDW